LPIRFDNDFKISLIHYRRQLPLKLMVPIQ